LLNKGMIAKNMRVDHAGIVVDVDNERWDSGSAGFCSAFREDVEDQKIYLYYTGSNKPYCYASDIGLATSTDGHTFLKHTKSPVLERQKGTFCSFWASTPAVFKYKNRYWMVLSGKRFSRDNMRIGLAYADDPIGPWKVIKELLKPQKSWEGCDIDNGPGVIVEDEEIYVFYSNFSMTYREYLSRLLSQGRIGAVLSKQILPRHSRSLTKYLRRRIGIFKLRINSVKNIDVHRYLHNPLAHLNGPDGSWNESSFCPGCIKLIDDYILFTANSRYSNSPFNQYIGMVSSHQATFKTLIQPPRKIIKGNSDKFDIMAPYKLKRELALDTPSPIIDSNMNSINIYYAVSDRFDNKWRVALTSLYYDPSFRHR